MITMRQMYVQERFEAGHGINHIGVKLIESIPMKYKEFVHTYEGKCPLTAEPDDREGYAVKYEDGYVSWSPKVVHDNAYRKTSGLTFGLALEALKKGFKLQRSGWNGKGMFVYLVKGREIEVNNLRNEAEFHYPLKEGRVKLCDHIDMKAANGDIVIGWLASQTDMLAEDWQIVE